MLIYLMRHGQARNLAPSDRERTLTEFGQREVEHVAQSLQSNCPPIRAIYTSPFVRARETTSILSRNWSEEHQVEVYDCLIPGGAFERILPVLDAAAHDAVMVVGHMPGISCLGGILTDANLNSGPEFSTAAVMCIETEMVASGLGCLRWYKRPVDWPQAPS